MLSLSLAALTVTYNDTSFYVVQTLVPYLGRNEVHLFTGDAPEDQTATVRADPRLHLVRQPVARAEEHERRREVGRRVLLLAFAHDEVEERVAGGDGGRGEGEA